MDGYYIKDSKPSELFLARLDSFSVQRNQPKCWFFYLLIVTLTAITTYNITTYNITEHKHMEKTPEVLKALRYVKRQHPTLHKVRFNEEAQWLYTDKNDKPFEFKDNIDVGILQDAVDSLDTMDNFLLPVTIYV